MALLYDRYLSQIKHKVNIPWNIPIKKLSIENRKVIAEKYPKEYEELIKLNENVEKYNNKLDEFWNNIQKIRKEIQNCFIGNQLETQIITADNVAQYYFENKDKWTIADFPVVSPLFHSTWLEFSRPQNIEWKSSISRWAIWIVGEEITKYNGENIYRYDEFLEEQKLDERPRWILSAILYIKPQNSDYCDGPIGTWMLALDNEGEVVAQDFNDYSLSVEVTNQITHIKTFDWKQILDMKELFYCALLTVSLMHCKNVQIVDNNPSEIASRKWRRQGNQPLVKFKTLNIEPMKTILRYEGHSESTGLKHALHICRGHFRDYRERGLFGKHKGIYWWESFVRGNAKQGVVNKEYNIG